MSGSASLSTGPLTDTEKTDIRRFLGYPAIGADASGRSSWRFFDVYGQNEWRMNNLSAPELQQVRLYLSQLYPLETAILGASDNLDTDRAAVWQRNRNEVSDRTGLYNLWRRRLCGFLGIPAGPDLQNSSSQIII